MSPSTIIRFFLYAVLIDLTAKGLAEGRTLRRRHGHHLHSGHYVTEESVPRELSLRHLERNNFESRSRDSRQNNEMYRSVEGDRKGSLRSGIRRKRHGSVTYKQFTDKDREEFLRFKQLNSDWITLLNNQHRPRFDDYYELEVREAQNTSICNYTVVAIPDTRGSRVPSDLEHIICNHVGSSCQKVGAYCCIQTYRKVKVSYADNYSEVMKVYAGCVCALQVYGNLINTEKQLPIND